MKRVGILTLFYKTWNFGAQLQALALQRVIQGLGYECEQIRFVWSREQTRLNYESASVDQEAFESFAGRIPHSRKVYTPETLDEANEEYDIFICGSDQIWGVKDSMPIHVLPQMAFSFVRGGKRRIVYGASFGSGDIAENRKEVLRCFLGRLDAVSVREQSAATVVESMAGKPVVSVLDPVMLLPAGEWERIAQMDGGDCPEEGYVLLYNVSCSQTLYREAKKYAEKQQLRMVNLSYMEGTSVGPCDFIRLIAHADSVLTDSFHGSVLAVLFHKPFVTFGVDLIDTEFSRNIRVKDMLKICGLENRFCRSETEDWLSVLESQVDYRIVDERIRKAVNCSMDFLRGALRPAGKEKEEEKACEQLRSRIIDPGLCTGCGACTKCGASCIQMDKDILGFFRPVLGEKGCIDCGLCLELCPVFPAGRDAQEKSSAPVTYAARAADEDILGKSSSGGIFSVAAESILAQGGAVCGAVYDREKGFAVKHVCVSAEDDLEPLRKSKYVQSDLGDCFSEIEGRLKSGRKVLFTGTPCQTAGLKAYLQKEYEELYLVDLICGGVTAPLLWQKYTSFYLGQSETEAFDMRSKKQGFFRDTGKLAFSMSHRRNEEEYYYEKEEDLFLSSRMSFYGESCYQCAFKGNRHVADLTIGDCVGFNRMMPDENDNKGISLVIIRSEKGKEFLKGVKDKLIGYPVSYEEAAAWNEMLESSMRKPLGSDYLRGIAAASSMEKIYYEAKLIRLFQEREEIFRNFMLEIKRNELLSKLRKYAAFECRVEYDPLIKGRIVIYGAGKLGRALLDCMEGEPLCFLDRGCGLSNVCGYPVYRPGNREFQKLCAQNSLTVIVTPVWDYPEIREQLTKDSPELRVLSLEKVVEKLWV